MKYTKKEFDKFKENLTYDMFKTEVALEENKLRLKKLTKEREAIQAKIAQKEKDWEDTWSKKKEKLSRDERETVKTMIQAIQDQLVGLKTDLEEAAGRENNCGQNIIMYEEFLKTAELSLEIATKKIGNKV